MVSLSFTLFALLSPTIVNSLPGFGKQDNDIVRRHLEAGTECVTYLQIVEFVDKDHEESWICQFSPEDATRFGGSLTVEIDGLTSEEMKEEMKERRAVSGGSVLRLGSNSYIEERQKRDNIFLSSESSSKVRIDRSFESSGKSLASSLAILHIPLDDDFEIEMMDENIDVRHYRHRRARRERRRNLAESKGTLNTLVVRVVDRANRSTRLSGLQLENDVFKDELCLKSQYEACSYGNLRIRQATEGGGSINGVIDVAVDVIASQSYAESIGNAARAATITRFGGIDQLLDTFDLVLFCQPPGTTYRYSGDGDWIGYASVNGWASYYNDVWCQSVSTQMHEVGHNLGLDHSGVGFSEYEDSTGMMGYSFMLDDAPRMCFNAAKSFQLGWYPAQMGTVDPLALPGGSQTFKLNGVADYDPDGINGDGLVTLRLAYQGNQMNGKDWYIGYNHKAGINSGTQEEFNRVTLLEKDNPNGDLVGFNEFGKSKLLAALDQESQNSSYSWYIGNTRVTLDVISIDGKDAFIRLTGGVGPEVSPTREPISAPVVTPSRVPTPIAPSRAPITAPISSPSRVPSSPSRTPTLLPINTPTRAPEQDLNICTDLLLDVTTDGKGNEVGWEISSSRNAYYSPPNNFQFVNNGFYSWRLCLPFDACYNLQFIDLGQDGICCEYGNGFYQGILNDNEIFYDPEWTTGFEQYEFCLDTDGKMVVPPTILQTDSPSPSPSIVASTPPSELPSVLPSNLPSNSPSITPSILPSKSPSASPILVASKAPSTSPSMLSSSTSSPSTSPSVPNTDDTTCDLRESRRSRFRIITKRGIQRAKTCGWLNRTKKGRKLLIYCQKQVAERPTVADVCPVTCGKICDNDTDDDTANCIDDPEYRRNGRDNRGCDWVAERPRFRCSLDNGVVNGCPATCGTVGVGKCSIDNTDTDANGEYCVDDPEYKRNGKENRSCEWVAGNPKFRCTLDRGVENACRATCDPQCSGGISL